VCVMSARKFTFRTVIVGPICVAHLMLSTYSSVSENVSGPDADVAKGQLVFNNACRTCHTTKEGDNRLGPHLYKIVGRKAGSLPNYGYSNAMKSADFVVPTSLKLRLQRVVHAAHSARGGEVKYRFALDGCTSIDGLLYADPF